MNFDKTRQLRRNRKALSRITTYVDSLGLDTRDFGNAYQHMVNVEVKSLTEEIRNATPDEIIANAAFIYRLTR